MNVVEEAGSKDGCGQAGGLRVVKLHSRVQARVVAVRVALVLAALTRQAFDLEIFMHCAFIVHEIACPCRV